MNRREFMDELERLLSEVPIDEKIDALQYYEDYFEDAGYEKEQDIIKELGSPEAVASIIKNDLGLNKNETEQKSEYKDYRSMGHEETSKTNHKSDENGSYSENTNYAQAEQNPSGSYAYGTETDGKPTFWDKLKHVDRKIWLIVLILCLPVTGGTILGIAGAFFGILIAIFACTFAFLVGGFSTIVGGIVLVVTGIIAKGVLTIGVGLILAAVGLMFFALSSLMCRVVIPAVVAGIRKLFQFFFREEGATA